MLDVTDFGHAVGEVELLAEDAERAHEEIAGFVEGYGWFFGGGGGGGGGEGGGQKREKPRGKLSAYLERFGYPGGGSVRGLWGWGEREREMES